MYLKGHKANIHYLKTYGSLDKFGYKDFILMFIAEKFNIDEWVELFKKAGAKFAGPVTEHADGFAMWNSKVNSFNSTKMVPKDIRFTTKGKDIFVFCMGLPYERIRVNKLTQEALKGKKVKKISLLGSKEKIIFSQDAQGISITPPQHRPNDSAISFKLER